MNVNPYLQARLRQLMELRGGPGVTAIESIQPVVLLGGFPNDRQPQLEKGEGLIRRWIGKISVTAVVGNYGVAQVRATPGQVLLVTDLWVSNEAAVTRTFHIARSLNITSLAAGSAHYVDTRLPFTDIGFNVPDISRGAAAAFTEYGAIRYWIPTVTTAYIPVEYVLHYNPASLTGLSVMSQNHNEGFTVSFQGLAFDEQP